MQDRWRIDDEWWRTPIHRVYYRVELEDGSLRTLYCDLQEGTWFQQHDSVLPYRGIQAHEEGDHRVR